MDVLDSSLTSCVVDISSRLVLRLVRLTPLRLVVDICHLSWPQSLHSFTPHGRLWFWFTSLRRPILYSCLASPIEVGIELYGQHHLGSTLMSLSIVTIHTRHLSKMPRVLVNMIGMNYTLSNKHIMNLSLCFDSFNSLCPRRPWVSTDKSILPSYYLILAFMSPFEA